MSFLKNTFLISFIILSGVFMFAPKTYAYTPFWALCNGYKEDVLAVVEITSKTENIFDGKIIFVFPQTKIEDLEVGDNIQIGNLDAPMGLTDEEFKNVNVGKKYLVSLIQDDGVFVPAMGVYEVTGSTYSDMQLVSNENSTDAALQIFINSGGETKDFNFVGDKVYVKGVEDYVAKVKSKNNHSIFYGIVTGIVIISTFSFFVYKKI